MKIKNLFVSILLLFIYQPGKSQQWLDVGGGADYQVYCFYHDTVSNLLYVGGHFDHLGANTIHQIGLWDGSNWAAVGANEQFKKNSFSGTIMAITLYNGELIAAGLFDSVAGIPANNIARWDGTQWNSMGNGFDERVYTLQFYNGELYAGGEFNHSGNDTIYNISKWDGTNWVRLSQGWGLDNAVTSMTIFNQKLIIGGLFGGPFLSSIIGRVIAWDGTNWLSMNGAFNDFVSRLKNINDTLYAVGPFTSFSSNPSNYISRWGGTAWQPMPYPSGGSQPQINDVVLYMGNLFVCGLFSQPPDIAKFNGSSYDSVGNAAGFVRTMIVYNDELYVAGGFSAINGIPLYNIARYNLGTGIEEISKASQLLIYPNPISVTEKLHFQFNDFAYEHYLNLFDIGGRNIVPFLLHNNESSLELPDKLKSGTYFITVTDKKNNKRSAKLILN